MGKGKPEFAGKVGGGGGGRKETTLAIWRRRVRQSMHQLHIQNSEGRDNLREEERKKEGKSGGESAGRKGGK